MELSNEIKELITRDAEALYDHLNEKAKEVDCYDFGLPMSDRQTKPIIDYITQYAEKWQEAQQLVERYEKALKFILKWEFPPTGQFWDIDKLQPMSYAACYGSNGERDFMRNVANEALTPKTGSDE